MEVDESISNSDNRKESAMTKLSKRLHKDKKSTPFNRSFVLSKPVKSSWKKKMEMKNEKAMVKAIETQLKAEKQAKIDEKRRRQEENKKRREENTRKNEIVQQIKNPKKLKKMGSKRIRKVQ